MWRFCSFAIAMVWCVMNFFYKVVWPIRSIILKLCNDCAKQFIRNTMNCGTTNHGFCIMITHQLTHRCRWVSFWPKTLITPRWLLPLPKIEDIDERKAFCYGHRNRSCWLYQKTYFRRVSRMAKIASISLLYLRGGYFEGYKLHWQINENFLKKLKVTIIFWSHLVWI